MLIRRELFTINCETVVVVALGVGRTVVVVVPATVVEVVEVVVVVDEVVVDVVGGLEVIVKEIEVAVAAP